MKRIISRIVAVAALAAPFTSFVFAQSNPATGLWKMVEPDKTVFIRTSEENGKLVGKVEKKILKNGTDATTGVCEKCTGDLKNKPLAGLMMIWGMEKEKDTGKWTGGKILEPDTGKIYACQIESTPDGKQLKVRGSILFISKTTTWDRVE